MKYIVAVSGGVDSVVLLDMLAKKGEHELIVAHFDHGIRPESDADARFVEALAANYGLAFEQKREELGKSASEELARQRRYEFLKDVARAHKGVVVTAHHQDDVIETIAINLQRGTGWRGLAVLGNTEVTRPLLAMTKKDLYAYALENKLEWVEDESNASNAYLRNRLRRKLHTELAKTDRETLLDIWTKQLELKREIEQETTELLDDKKSISRYFFMHVGESVALELLWALLAKRGLSLTRPQRKRMLHAIKTMQPGGTLEAGSGVKVEFGAREFVVKHT